MSGGKWDAGDLVKLNFRPPLYAPDPAKLWDDDYISSRILETHLDPDVEAASRAPEVIDTSVRWISRKVPLGGRILDLGCGPGLYAHRLAEKGFGVVGVDLSRRSLQYARERAKENGLDIDYRRMDFRRIDFREEFDAVLIAYGELGALLPEDRDSVLEKVRAALRPGGVFIFDVMTPSHRVNHPFSKNWYFKENGLFRPGPHFVLEDCFEYPNGLFMDRYVVVEEGGAPSVYDVLTQVYEAEDLRKLLRARGFTKVRLHSNLWGGRLVEGSEWIGALCHRT